ncbi:hypothetical protein P691DRAFT_680018 [Macrolepiota fuliginosa MF-IS2]|uniref:Endonuclease/exonuclease/phosphatase domain-containing protein n=1 Tax=Macrolepiota fuliginosa MF-IS2 TaxID=1400762 RepID=A0A9P5X2A3_9AGAR|nr:hypothetical protein P691DRAFT_680018 [Macrolepiota fuliginosa MF-IS2]
MPPLSPTHSTLPVRIIQLNCNKKGSAIHMLLNKALNNADILLLKEPWWSRISPNDMQGPVGHRAWIPILPTTSQKPDDPPPLRVIAYYQPWPRLEVALRADLAQDRDMQILSISILGKPTMTIINLYNDQGH